MAPSIEFDDVAVREVVVQREHGVAEAPGASFGDAAGFLEEHRHRAAAVTVVDRRLRSVGQVVAAVVAHEQRRFVQDSTLDRGFGQPGERDQPAEGVIAVNESVRCASSGCQCVLFIVVVPSDVGTTE
jgi:hypothetical protein